MSEVDDLKGWRPARKPPLRLHAIGYVALEVPDLPRSRDFYARVLNLAVTEEDERSVYLRCGAEHHCIELHRAPAARLRHVAFETRDEAEAEALRGELAAAGLTVEDVAPSPGCLGPAFRFQDPEGNRFEIYPAQRRRACVLARGSMPALRLGHVTYRCEDVLALARFHRETAGFRVSDYQPRFSVFLRCNPEHHCLAFIERGRRLFHHLAFDVGGWDGVKLALDWLTREGWAIEDGPLRHPEGNNLAAYLGDPDGFHVELYCEMERIADDLDHARPDYLPFRNLWMRSQSPAGYHETIPRDEHGRFVRPPAGAAEG